MATRLSTIDRIINPKHEIRNSKQSQMTKFRMFETNKSLRHLDFENSNLPAPLSISVELINCFVDHDSSGRVKL